MKRIQPAGLAWAMVFCTLFASAQQTAITNTSVVVPPLVKFSGTLNDARGKPLSGAVGVTFALYKEEQGGAPLWLETQNVTADKNGHYTVMLGSSTSTGLPADIFVAGEARWLAIRPEGQEEQARVLLLSVPYALKARDAETIGGLPPSAFLLAPNSREVMNISNGKPKGPAASVSHTTSDVTTMGGTVNALPLFSTATNIQNSAVTQTGSGTTANVGVHGTLTLPATGTAKSIGGANSQPQDLIASSFSSSTSTAITQTFQWQAEPAGNNTATPSATVNLLYGAGASKPAETGLHIASNGQVTFATGQIFPGTAELSTANTFAQNQTMNGSLTVGGGAAIGGTSGTEALFVLNFGTGSGINSLASGNGVVGSSAASSGTIAGAMGKGSSSAGYGVEGSSPNIGVYGTATGAKSYGVEGSSPNVGVFGDGTGSVGIGVDGHGANVGVKGVATTSTGLAGLFQGNVTINSGGKLNLAGNAEQARSMGGFVKAIAYVDPRMSGKAGIVRCYNSQNGSSTPPCGFNFLYETLGDYVVDFGFQVNDRFIQVTPVFVGGGFDEYQVGASVCLDTCRTITSSQVEVNTFYPSGASVPNPPFATNTPFFIMIF
jgi:hypothetical protein